MAAPRRSLCLAAALLIIATRADAEWTASAYFGQTWTAPASLTLDQPSRGIHITWTDVHFTSRAFDTPIYYGYRVAWFPSSRARFGVQGEITHLKVYAAAGALAPAVQSFAISHGLNLILANLVWRQPPASGRRLRFTARGGAGFTVPHGESEVFGVVQEQYEVSTIAIQGAAGPVIRLAPHVNALAEYKLSTTKPTVSVADATIKGRYTTQHLTAGLEVWW